jgi:hypothetical protein
MVRVFILATGAALAVLPGHAESPSVPEARPSVGVYLDFDSAPGDAAVEIMKHEVDEILKPSGVALDWRLAKENHGQEAFTGLVVLKFRGRCRIETWAPQAPNLAQMGDTETLGATKVVNGRVTPFSEVQCDRIKQALAYLHADQKDRQRAFGVALGRVVAHELYHILARTTGHAAMGLAKATESMEDLVGPRTLSFREEDSEAIRNSLLGQ